MKMAEVVAERSTCVRRKVGAVLVKDKHVLSTGYNGAASGVTHCSEQGCMRQEMNIPSGERHELCRAVHAEMNTIAQAAFHGVKTEGAVLYCTHQPCFMCAKILLNAGVHKVIYQEGYPDELTFSLIPHFIAEKLKRG
ncbi:MAG: dCMP deaminase family protein [bacterium]|nr:dCMP deaminase family protein [bacterium]